MSDRSRRSARALASVVSVSVSISVALPSSVAWAQSAGTQRALRNLNTAFSNVHEVPALAETVAVDQQQTAKNLLRDCDYAIQRGDGELDRVPVLDRAYPSVIQAQNRLNEIKEYRNKLAAALDASTKGAADLAVKYRAFREDAKAFAGAVGTMQNLEGATMVTAGQLATVSRDLDGLAAVCAKYMPLGFDKNLAFQLNVDPNAWCALPPKKGAVMAAAVAGTVKRDLALWGGMLKDTREAIATQEGFVRFSGNMCTDLVWDRQKTLAGLVAKYKDLYDAAGAPMPEGVAKPIDDEVTAVLAEIDRLAPTWAWPTGLVKDGGLESTAKSSIEQNIPGSKVLKTGMLRPEWGISKNDLGIILSRYRTGVALYKSPSDKKWCHFREWTITEDYAGAGKYQKSSSAALSAIRYQKCQ